jgi:hypothetical protein
VGKNKRESEIPDDATLFTRKRDREQKLGLVIEPFTITLAAHFSHPLDIIKSSPALLSFFRVVY